MGAAVYVLSLFDWRSSLGRAGYRRNFSILVLVNLIVAQLGFLGGAGGYAFTALLTAAGLVFDAQRYHDAGRSAAWIAWGTLIPMAVFVAAFQFVPNVLESIPLPASLSLSAGAQTAVGRILAPAAIGFAFGYFGQSLYLALAPTKVGANPFARKTAVDSRVGALEADDAQSEAASQAIIERHLAMRREAERAGDPAPLAGARQGAGSPAPFAGAPRVFGKRRAG